MAGLKRRHGPFFRIAARGAPIETSLKTQEVRMTSAANPLGVGVAAPAPLGVRMLDQLASGKSIDHIAQTRNYTRLRVEKFLRAELKAIAIRPARDYAKIQIRRLDALTGKLTEMADKGDLGAVDRLLKVLDRLDRYHGFSARALPDAAQGEISYDRLYKKIFHAARNHDAAQSHS
jgi:hypothetical protein